MRIILVLALLFGGCPAEAGELVGSFKYAENKLRAAGFDRAFLRALGKTYEPKGFQDVVELNVNLFLKKTDYHGVQVTDAAVASVSEFMRANGAALDAVQRRYGPSGPVIASLLWIESRYGRNLGSFHVASVYLHLLQSDRADVLARLKGGGAKRFNAAPSKKDLAKIPGRAKKKAAWAMSELRALQKVFRKRGDFALGLRGSFSGAFGLCQFLPSSYLNWAKSARPPAAPDLLRPDDAIHSVAFYLQRNGWRRDRPKTYVRALMNYNNSSDYANAILALAKKVESRSLAFSEQK